MCRSPSKSKALECGLPEGGWKGSALRSPLSWLMVTALISRTVAEWAFLSQKPPCTAPSTPLISHNGGAVLLILHSASDIERILAPPDASRYACWGASCHQSASPVSKSYGPSLLNWGRGGWYRNKALEESFGSEPFKLKYQARDSCPEAQCPKVHGLAAAPPPDVQCLGLERSILWRPRGLPC